MIEGASSRSVFPTDKCGTAQTGFGLGLKLCG
jgi:hypothetical protein